MLVLRSINNLTCRFLASASALASALASFFAASFSSFCCWSKESADTFCAKASKPPQCKYRSVQFGIKSLDRDLHTFRIVLLI